MNNSSENTITDVGLKFPFSTCCYNEPKVFIMSYNDACQSEFIKNILEMTYDDYEPQLHEPEGYYEIVIPRNLYKFTRFHEIQHLIDLWTGRSNFHNHHRQMYNFKDIARISQSLLLSENLEFVKILEKEYPPSL